MKERIKTIGRAAQSMSSDLVENVVVPMKEKITGKGRRLTEREAEVNARMNARRSKLIGRVAILNVSAFLVLYLLIGFGYYCGDGFRCNTKVNGISCKGKSLEEVNSELCKTIEYQGVNVKDLNGSSLYVNASDVGFNVDFTEALNKAVSEQNAFAWGKYLIKGMDVSVEPTISYDKEKLDQVIGAWDIFVPDESQKVAILKTEEGYTVQNTLLSTPKKDNIVNAVGDVTLSMGSEIDLSADEYADCYDPVTLTPEQQEIVDFCGKLQRIVNSGITYQFGSKTIPLKGEVADGFIVTYEQLAGEELDNPGTGKYIAGSAEISAADGNIRNIEGFAASESGDPLISEARLYDFIYQMAKDTNTADLLKRYQRGEDVEIMVRKDRTGITQIFDKDAEYNKLKQTFIEGTYDQEEVRNLTDKKKVDFFNAKSELKGTYIELDISNQHLYYYKNGEVYIETEIVSGTMKGGHGTPAGLFHVYDKQRDKVLVGEDYECPVEYWMRLTETGVGIHDAWWQRSFGGDAYLEAGSHGCINCPPYIAAQLYEAVKEKTPVIVYYR